MLDCTFLGDGVSGILKDPNGIGSEVFLVPADFPRERVLLYLLAVDDISKGEKLIGDVESELIQTRSVH